MKPCFSVKIGEMRLAHWIDPSNNSRRMKKSTVALYNKVRVFKNSSDQVGKIAARRIQDNLFLL